MYSGLLNVSYQIAIAKKNAEMQIYAKCTYIACVTELRSLYHGSTHGIDGVSPLDTDDSLKTTS